MGRINSRDYQDVKDTLNMSGGEGWELVSVVADGTELMMFFKRSKPSHGGVLAGKATW